jgi:hypothetical protein
MFGERPTFYRVTLGVVAIAVAVATATAVWVQIAGLVSQGDFTWTQYFSYFTIVTVVANCIVLLYGGFQSLTTERDQVGMTATRHLLITLAIVAGVIYHLLLRDAADPTNPYTAWSSLPMQVFHTILPIYLVVDWVLNPYRAKSPWWTLGGALGFPALWFALSLVRGSQTGWYPYDFVNPAGSGGVGRVVTMAVAAGAMLAIVHLTLLATNRLSHRLGTKKNLVTDRQ